jgi:hypothetical protein
MPYERSCADDVNRGGARGGGFWCFAFAYILCDMDADGTQVDWKTLAFEVQVDHIRCNASFVVGGVQ